MNNYIIFLLLNYTINSFHFYTLENIGVIKDYAAFI